MQASFCFFRHYIWHRNLSSAHFCVYVKFKVSCSLYWAPMLPHRDGQSRDALAPQQVALNLISSLSFLSTSSLLTSLSSPSPPIHPRPHRGTRPAFVQQCLRGLVCKCSLMHACVLISLHAIMCSVRASCICVRTDVDLSCKCVAWPYDHKLNQSLQGVKAFPLTCCCALTCSKWV